ncbi:MAG: VOC family protein [Porticoccaceae bacterium]
MRIHELGHLVLYVRDLERSRRFYRDVLGWNEIRGEVPLPVPAAAFSSGRTHHELLLIWARPRRRCPRGTVWACTTSASRSATTTTTSARSCVT